MKKRILSMVLALCLLVCLLPTTALADGDYYRTYAEFKAAAETATGTPLYMDSCDFTWPEGWPAEGDTLHIKRPISINGDSWEIPSNITLEFSGSGVICGYGGSSAHLTINGTVINNTGNEYFHLLLVSEYGYVTIADGAKLEGSFYIEDHNTWILAAGSTVDHIALGGTLIGEGGTVTGTLTVNNGYSSWGDEDWTAVLGGSLNLEGGLSVYHDSLIVAEGSEITAGEIYAEGQNSKLSLNGQLSLNSWGTLNGTMDIGSNGVLVLDESCELDGHGRITGTGTIQADEPAYPFLFSTPLWLIAADRAAYANLVAETITIRCPQVGEPCQHSWGDGVTTTQPTCTASGVKTYTCAKCGQEKTEALPSLGHAYVSVVTDPTPESQGYTTHTCSRCGDSYVDSYTEWGVFTDVKTGSYYEEAVSWAVANGVTTGLTATTFGPSQNCTRGQIVTFLWRSKGCPQPETTVNPFTDVKESDYYYKAVLWAAENGVTTGATDTTFNPAGNCTRAQAVTFLWRSAGQPAASSTNGLFTDVKAGSYYAEAVAWAVEQGITNGATATTFGPNDNCIRAQIVTFLYRSVTK